MEKWQEQIAKNSDYWRDRMASAQNKLTEKSAKEIDKQLEKYYSNAMKHTIKGFEDVFNTIDRQIANGKPPTPALLYQLDSYWEMQAQLKGELEKLGNQTMLLFGDVFEDSYRDIYHAFAKQSGTAFSTIATDNARQMIEQIWCADGLSFSQRVWGNTQDLIEELNAQLVRCVVTGATTEQLKQALIDRFQVSYNNADMIARTELAHIQTQARRQNMIDLGAETYEVYAHKGERTCEVCGKLHGTRYPIAVPPPVPAHPRCRCSIIPVIEDK